MFRPLPHAASLCLLVLATTFPSPAAAGATVVGGARESVSTSASVLGTRSVPHGGFDVGPTRALQIGLVSTVVPVGVGAIYANRNGGSSSRWSTTCSSSSADARVMRMPLGRSAM